MCVRDAAFHSGGHRQHLEGQWPPYKSPDLPQRYDSDPKIPRIHKEAMRSKHAHRLEDSTGREFYGLLDAGTFESVHQPVDNYINAMRGV